MQKNVLQIIWLWVLLGFTSMVYFLSLAISLPVVVTAVLVAAFGYLSYRWLGRHIAIEDPVVNKNHTTWACVILLVGIVIITNKAYYLEPQYGYWDAWWIWNYHAKFLGHPEFAGFLISKHSLVPHPDYPLFVSGSIAFFWRLMSTDNISVSYALSFLTTLVIPVTIFLALYRRNIVVAALAFLLLAVDDFYLERALAQYADLPLGFAFLCAFICLENVKKQPLMTVVTSAVLGCCLWTKNEGAMLTLVFITLNCRSLFGRGRWKPFLSGFAFPLLVFVFFKLSARSNDLFELQDDHTRNFIFDWSRYEMVWESLIYNLSHNFVAVKIGLIAFAILCFVERRLPDRAIIVLLVCTTGYFFVYVLTPKSLDWHLATSMDRVLFHIVPSYIYVLARNFSRLHFRLETAES